MPESPATEIRSKLSNYLDGKISLRAFRDWFAPVAWLIENSQDSLAIELAYSIEGVLAECTSAHWSEQDLRDELANTIFPLRRSA